MEQREIKTLCAEYEQNFLQLIELLDQATTSHDVVAGQKFVQFSNEVIPEMNNIGIILESHNAVHTDKFIEMSLPKLEAIVVRTMDAASDAGVEISNSMKQMYEGIVTLQVRHAAGLPIGVSGDITRVFS